jgi:hypothetical protein
MGFVAGLIYGFLVTLILGLLVSPFLGVIGLIVFGVLAGMLPFIDDVWGPIKMTSYAKSLAFWLAVLFGAIASWYALMNVKLI